MVKSTGTGISTPPVWRRQKDNLHWNLAPSGHRYRDRHFYIVVIREMMFQMNSSDPLDRPVYDPNFLSNEYDHRAQIAMAKYIRQIAQTATFSKVWDAEYERGLDVV